MSQSPTENLTSDSNAPGARPQKRRFARADVSVPVQYTLAGGKEQQGEIVNLGGGGVRVASTEDLNRGEMLTLRFALPGVAHEVVARGKVVLSFFEGSTSRYAHGIAFAQIATEDQKRIMSYVESIQHEKADVSI